MYSIKLEVIDQDSGEAVSDTVLLMRAAGLEPDMGYESIGIQEDGTAVVFDKCGNYGVLPPRYVVTVTPIVENF